MRQRFIILLKLSPLLIPFAIIFSTGILLTILQSLGFLLPIKAEGGMFSAYHSLFSSLWFYQDLGFSLYCAFVSAVFSVAIGTLFSYYIWRLPARLQQFGVLSRIPLILPHIAAAFIVLIFFSRSGYVSSVMYKMGVIKEQARFPSILFGGNGFGIIIAYVYKEVPFVMLLVTSVLKKFDFRRVETARMFGASRARIFIKIVLPFLFPVLHTSFIILFLYSFGAFDIPYVIGESHPGMLSVQVYNLYFKRDLTNRPRAMAILAVMFLFSLFFIYLYSKISRRLDVKSRRL